MDFSSFISRKSLAIPPFLVMDILERALEMENQGEKVIHLEVGEPDFPTPKCIIEAGIKALREGKTKYTPSLGLGELRQALAEYYAKKYGKEVSPHQIIITNGSSPAMFLLFATLLKKGEEVILTNPYYSCYPNIIHFLGGEVNLVNVYEDNGFQYSPEQVARQLTSKTKAILINSPANPTGSVLSAQVVKELAELGHYLVSDETYHGLTYESSEHTVLEFTDRAFVIGSFSKQYAMTGWRLGYLIAPEEFVRPIQKIQQNFFISANSFVQWAGIAAIKEAQEEVEEMRGIFNQRRKFIISRLRQMGFDLKFLPQGAFYVLVNVKKFTQDSYSFALNILSRAKVAVTPGIDFGDNAEGYLRVSYANSLENIKEGMDRLEHYLKNL
ncbi:MAG: pyridoxal phosphate-dependent aminotransferase [Desulfobacterota bacterium]|nr:pyridoxal phosphate-dependent aminotransferase [Thermodesulfobacteriota bacterium]